MHLSLSSRVSSSLGATSYVVDALKDFQEVSSHHSLQSTSAGESAITPAGRKHFFLEPLWLEAKTPCVLAAVIVAGYVCTVGLPDLAVFAQLAQSPASANHVRHTHIIFI